MKRKKAYLFLTCIVGAVLLIYALPILFQNARAKPLHGYFGTITCACGHEIFYELTDDKAFEVCPAHHEKKFLGKVIRTRDTATVISPEDHVLEYIFTYNGSTHSCDFLYPGSSPGPIEQISNPWRTHFPKYLPES